MEQIIAKLREIEKLTGQGMSIPLAAKKVGVTDQTFYRWRIRYGALKERRPSVCSCWSRRTRGSSASLPTRPSTSPCSRTPAGKVVSPARRRAAVQYLVRWHRLKSITAPVTESFAFDQASNIHGSYRTGADQFIRRCESTHGRWNVDVHVVERRSPDQP